MTYSHNVHGRPVLAGIAALMLSLLAAPAVANEFYVNTNGATTNLYIVDPATGSTTLIGDTGQGMTDIALAPDGTLYATNGFELFTLDKNNGSSTFAAGISNVTFLSGLDFDSSGTLFAGDEGTNELWSIDTSNGNATVEKSTGVVFNGDIAHEQGDVFYATGQFLADINLFKVDLSDPLVGNQGLIAFGEFFGGLDFDTNGNLFAFASDGDIYEIQNYATSGTGTFASSSGLSGVAGATHIFPEPSTAMLITMALAAAARRRTSD